MYVHMYVLCMYVCMYACIYVYIVLTILKSECALYICILHVHLPTGK